MKKSIRGQTMICEECKEKFNGVVHCNACWWILKEENEELKSKIKQLEDEKEKK